MGQLESASVGSRPSSLARVPEGFADNLIPSGEAQTPPRDVMEKPASTRTIDLTGSRFGVLNALANPTTTSSIAHRPAEAPADKTRERLEADIRFLAHDLLEGRGTPSAGERIAALYIANRLRAAGLKPAGTDKYRQVYSVGDYTPTRKTYRITINGTELSPDDYVFAPWGMDPASSAAFETVFAGHGLVDYEREINQLEGTDLRGKAVISLYGAPWEIDPSQPFGTEYLVGKGVQAAGRDAGFIIYPSAEFFVPGGPASAEVALFTHAAQAPQAFIPEHGEQTLCFAPSLVIKPEVFDRLYAAATGGSYSEWQERLRADPNFKPRPIDVSLKVEIEAEPTVAPSSNVIAKIPGSDPVLKDEWIVISAHYDHLGVLNHGESGGHADSDDTIFNGADDNASGVAAALEVARRLADENPKRSILVVVASGEERGLLGSAHYAKNPTVPMEKVVANINLDMVGRLTEALWAVAPGSDDLFDKAEEIGSKYGIKIIPDQLPAGVLAYLTDYYHFLKNNVPSVEFFSGFHEDYHQPSDEADTIEYENLVRVVDLATDLVRSYASSDERPRFERPEWFVTPSPAESDDADSALSE